MNKSETIVNLSKALAAAQGEMPAIKFDSTNGFLGNKFASLGAVIEATRPILAKHGLSIAPFPIGDGGAVGIEVILLHTSGEWISNSVLLEVGAEKGKSSAQVAGSIISYLRRYALSSICGVYADEDGDGNKPAPAELKAREEEPKASGGKYARPMSPETLKEALQKKAASAKPASEKQTNLVRVLLLEHFADREDERRQAQEYLTGHKSFKDIEPTMISAILDWMKPTQSSDGSGAYELDKNAKIELTMVARQFMEDLGQQTLAI